MSMLNSLLRSLTDALLIPFRALPAFVSLVVISAVFAVVALYIFKWTSNQDKIEAVKRKIHAGLFEIRLYNDDLRAILRALSDIVRHNVVYVGLSLPPLLVMIVPFVLVIAQLQGQYGYAGLEPGRSAFVKVELKEGYAARFKDGDKPPVELVVPEGLKIDSPSIWSYPLNEMAWRVVPEERGRYEVEVRWDGGDSVTKSVVVSDEEITLRSPGRFAPGFWDQLLFPMEDPLPEEAPIRAVRLTYEELMSAGVPTWLWIFLVLSVVLAFVLAKPLGIKL